MSEIGSSAAVGIESVEWLDGGAGALTVRVTGRWRRRRGWGSGAAGFRTPAVLVVEADGQRHRFPAMPEPPSLSGAAPGTWRLGFSVPGELAPRLGGHAYLTLGTVTIALPVPDSGMPDPPAPAPADPAPPIRAQSTRISSGPDAGSGPKRAFVAPGAPAGEPGPPTASDSPAGTPEQPTGSDSPGEPAGGHDGASLEIERAWRRADEAERASAALEDRISELEGALAQSVTRDDLVRRSAEDAAAARQAEVTRRVRTDEQESARLEAEAVLRRRHPRPQPRVPSEPTSQVPLPVPPLRQGGAGLPEAELVTALRRELGARATAEATLRARLVQAETRLAARVLLEQRTELTLTQVRAELVTLAETLERERAARRGAEAEMVRLRAQLSGRHDRSRDVSEAITEVRAALEGLREPPGRSPAPAPPADPSDDLATPRAIGPSGSPFPPAAGRAAPSDPAGTVTPERLSDALARLREAQDPAQDDAADASAATVPGAPGADAGPAAGALGDDVAAVEVTAWSRAPGAPTVDGPFRRLVRRDPEQAGRLALDLLSAQRLTFSRPVAYDLVLGPGRGCVQVTAGEGPPSIVVSAAPRPRDRIDFQVVGDPARLARLLVAGRLRRLLRIGVARVRGAGAGLESVRAVLALPLDLAALARAGMRVEPDSLLALVSGMIDPAWTRGESFTVACTDGSRCAYLQVRDGAAPRVTRAAPPGRVALELTGSGPALVRTLTSGGDGAGVVGDAGALAVLRRWIQLAQCG